MFNPSPAMPWFNGTGGSTPQPSYTGSPYGSQPYTGETGQAGDPGYENTEVARWDQYIATIQASMAASAGWAREQERLKYEDAKKGRDLQWKIAQLQSSGADDRLLMQLKEQGRQFDANHGIEMEKLGLSREQFGFTKEIERGRLGLERDRLGVSRAQTATEYLSTPDRFMQSADFLNMSGRYFANQPGVTPYGQSGTPTPKTEADFAVLESGGNPNAGRGSAVAAAGEGGAGGDARLKALTSILKAVPPSEGTGLDENDYAVLQAAKALYSTNLRPGTYERMRPGQQAIMESAGRRLGYDVNDWRADNTRNGVGQGSVRRVA